MVHKTVISTLAILLISGCGMQTVSRNSGSDQPIIAPYFAAETEASLTREADLLVKQTTDFVRASTLRGAGIGAALGCGLSAATGGANCLQAAVAGAAIGGFAGHAAGQKSVEKRVEIISPKALLPRLSAAKAQTKTVQSSVQTLLAAQAEERALLTQRLVNKEISQEAFDIRLTEMRDIRHRLASALTLSATQIDEVSQALSGATSQGQAGLDWYALETEALHEQVISTRSLITLL